MNKRLAALLLAWRVPILLGVLSLVLAGAVWRGLTRPLPVPAAPAGAAAGEDAGSGEGPVFDPEPVTAFSAMVDRPLFSRSRRPAPAATAATAGARPGGSGSPFLLSGILIAGPSRVAFLQPIAEKKTLRVLEGETVEGWRIEKILPERVVIGSGDLRAELTLKDRIAPAPARATEPGRPGQPGQPPAPPAAEAPPPEMPPPEAMETDEMAPESFDGTVDEPQ